MERKKEELNMQVMAVRDFAEARRLAFDDHASKLEQKFHVAAIDCAEKKRVHDRVAAQLV